MATLVNKIKYNRFLYMCYYYLGNLAISIIKTFIKPQDNLVLFVSFGGRRFDDSPKAIYDELIKDPRFDGYELVWAFVEPEKYLLPRGQKIKIDTFSYYKKLLKARVWITNSSVTRGLNFIGKNTFQLNTWHGSAIKKMGTDISVSSMSFSLKGKKDYTSIMLAQGQYDVDIFTRVFGISKDKFRIIGLPRNDELATVSVMQKCNMKKTLGLPEDKKVILYAPTYREYEKDSFNNCVLTPPVDLAKWKQQLGNNFVVLFRAHYEVVKVMNIIEDDFIKDVSSYPRLNDLMIASDILVSDYSSIFFDYSIMGKPMLCFAYDFDIYSKVRGLYFNIRKELDSESIQNEDQLICTIKNLDYGRYSDVARHFCEKYVEQYGNASKMSLNIILESIL